MGLFSKKEEKKDDGTQSKSEAEQLLDAFSTKLNEVVAPLR